MVGDDIEADIGGAKEAGLGTVLVRTGKFREASPPRPTSGRTASWTRSRRFRVLRESA